LKNKPLASKIANFLPPTSTPKPDIAKQKNQQRQKFLSTQEASAASCKIAGKRDSLRVTFDLTAHCLQLETLSAATNSTRRRAFAQLRVGELLWT